jgi:hypothetical protein
VIRRTVLSAAAARTRSSNWRNEFVCTVTYRALYMSPVEKIFVAHVAMTLFYRAIRVRTVDLCAEKDKMEA